MLYNRYIRQIYMLYNIYYVSSYVSYYICFDTGNILHSRLNNKLYYISYITANIT